MKSAVKGCIAPVLTSSNSPPIALGRPAMMPAKMIIEMPLPMPRSVICSPSHIRNIVPVTRVATVTNRNITPGSSTSPDCPSSAIAIPSDCASASASVP